jgi:imidazolonepropionase-like amidohydrolase
VLLGTDALVSGAGTLLEELAAARATGFVPDARLEAAVGAVAARRLGLPAPTLEPGAPADLVALRAPLLSARPRDVALVLVAGRPVLADEELAAIFDAAGVPHEPLVVGGVAKRVAAPLGSVARAVFDLAPECRRIVA